MEQPPGFEVPGKEEWVMKLIKSIYGMKQVSHIWNQTFHKAVSEWPFECLPCEWCICHWTSPTGTIIFTVHIDDIIVASSSVAEVDCFHDFLKPQWEITELGEPNYALDIAISHNQPAQTISISQTTKIDNLLEQYGQVNVHLVDTPMVLGLQLHQPDKSMPVPYNVEKWMEQTPYHPLVESLMYLAVATHPNISDAVSCLWSFLDCYRHKHWDAAIQILRYLKGTQSHALTLSGTNPLSLSSYSNSNYTNCMDTSWSVGGYCFTLGSSMISWSSQKQKTVVDSSCYPEYIALHNASHKVIFLRQLLKGLQLLPNGPMQLLCDNDATSRLTEDHVWHSHTKHIQVRYHYTHELVLAGECSVLCVGSKDNIANILTKPLAHSDFQQLCHYLGVQATTPMWGGVRWCQSWGGVFPFLFLFFLFTVSSFISCCDIICFFHFFISSNISHHDIIMIHSLLAQCQGGV